MEKPYSFVYMRMALLFIIMWILGSIIFLYKKLGKMCPPCVACVRDEYQFCRSAPDLIIMR